MRLRSLRLPVLAACVLTLAVVFAASQSGSTDSEVADTTWCNYLRDTILVDFVSTSPDGSSILTPEELATKQQSLDDRAATVRWPSPLEEQQAIIEGAIEEGLGVPGSDARSTYDEAILDIEHYAEDQCGFDPNAPETFTE